MTVRSRRDHDLDACMPVLDVAVRFADAVRLHERAGWSRLGTVTTVFGDGDTLDEYVCIGRLPPESRHGRAEGRVEVSSS